MSNDSHWDRATKTLAFLVLLTLVALRPLIGESYDTSQNSISAGMTELAPPMPARTMIIDMVILGTSAVVMVRAWRGREFQRAGLEWGFFLCAIAGLLSCLAAGQKRVAINAALDWLCLPVMAMALIQVMTHDWHRRLLLAVIIASAAANAVECLDETYFSLPETVREYEQHRDAFWRERGIPLDSDMVRMFEARLKAGEAHGFLVHGNVTGGYLVMVLLTAAGIVIAAACGSSRADASPGANSMREPKVASGARAATLSSPLAASAIAPAGHAPAKGVMWMIGLLLAAILAWAIVLTGSLGAIVGGTTGLVAWAITWAARRWIAAHPRKAVGVACGLAVIAGGAVVGHGLHHGSLPGASLNFRWQYWQASAPLIRDHFWTGVGRENFGRHYVQYKSILSPEEVASPHNLFVQAAADWGVLGLAGLCAMIAGAMLTLSRAYVACERGFAVEAGTDRPVDRHATRASPACDGHDGGRSDSLWTWLAAAIVFIAVFGARCSLLGSDNIGYVVWVTFVTGVAWSAACALMLALSHRVSHWRWMAAAGAAGLASFLVQDTINFAFYIPASATTCFALYAFVVSCRRVGSGRAAHGQTPRRSEASRNATPLPGKPFAPTSGDSAIGGVVAGIVMLLLVVAVWQATLVVRSNDRLAEARGSLQTTQVVVPAQGIAFLFETSARIDSLDPTPWVESGDAQLRSSTAGATDGSERLAAAVFAYTEALKRDPQSTDIRRRLARTYMETSRVAKAGSSTTLGDAADCARRASAIGEEITRLYPADPSAWRLLGEALALAAEMSGDGNDDRKRAVEAFNHALELDASRPDWEVIRRFSSEVRRQIEDQVKALTEAR